MRFTHQSSATSTPMTFAVFLPPSITSKEDASKKIPYILYLSGLTCTDENVCQKGAPFKKLAEMQIALVAPDTSPRGAGVPGEDDNWDFGTGAGFYLDATAASWEKNYRMYSYITQELPALLETNLPCLDMNKAAITGHSMGGHGALTIALKNPDKFKSVSAFAPICNPSECPWGKNAFGGYLNDKSEWAQYDATELVRQMANQRRSGGFDDMLIDVGTADSFLTGGQLLPEAFQKAADEVGQKITLRYQEGYDHSYFFISSFIDEHIAFHAARLQN